MKFVNHIPTFVACLFVTRFNASSFLLSLGRKEKSSLEGKTSKASTQSETSLKRLREKYDNKLEDLENLQYMLTARKLQDQPPEPMNRADVKVTMLSTSDSSPEESFNNGFVKPSGKIYTVCYIKVVWIFFLGTEL